MATEPLKPASLQHSGPATFFEPTAESVFDSEGNVVQPGPDALEVQRANFKAAEEFANNPEAQKEAEEEKDLKHVASQVAEEEGVSKQKAVESLKQKQVEDSKSVPAPKIKKPAVEDKK